MPQQVEINDKFLANIESTNKYNSEKRKQTDVHKEKIVKHLDNIDTTYRAMDNNNTKYDFTSKDSNGKPVLISLNEDRTLTSALIRDNATYLAEQNNLYVVGTLTMATLLVAAILISK